QGRIELVGLRAGFTPACRMVTRFRWDLLRRRHPPPALMFRVASTVKPEFFLVGGYKAFVEVSEALARHRPLADVRRLLDWGCGCGRITAHWLRLRRGPAVFG